MDVPQQSRIGATAARGPMRRTPRPPSKQFIPHLGSNPMVQATATPYLAYVAIPAGSYIAG